MNIEPCPKSLKQFSLQDVQEICARGVWLVIAIRRITDDDTLSDEEQQQKLFALSCDALAKERLKA